MDEICANTESLDAHLKEEEKKSEAFENMMEELEDVLLGDIEDVKALFDSITKRHGLDYDFIEFVRESL